MKRPNAPYGGCVRSEEALGLASREDHLAISTGCQRNEHHSVRFRPQIEQGRSTAATPHTRDNSDGTGPGLAGWEVRPLLRPRVVYREWG